MADLELLAGDSVARALSWVSTRGIEVRSWPPAAPDHAAALTSPGSVDLDPSCADHPVLYVVEPGMEPPHCRNLEDWVRIPLDLGELNARVDRLVAWSHDLGAAYTRVDDDDVLRVGDEMVVLSQLEARLMRALIANMGALLLREDLVAIVWPHGPPSDPRALDNRVKYLRAHLSGVPLRIHTVRSRGLLLERLPA